MPKPFQRRAPKSHYRVFNGNHAGLRGLASITGPHRISKTGRRRIVEIGLHPTASRGLMQLTSLPKPEWHLRAYLQSLINHLNPKRLHDVPHPLRA